MSLEDFNINDAPYNLGSMPWPENRRLNTYFNFGD